MAGDSAGSKASMSKLTWSGRSLLGLIARIARLVTCGKVDTLLDATPFIQGLYKKGDVATHIAKKVSRHAAVQLPIDHTSESCVMGRN